MLTEQPKKSIFISTCALYFPVLLTIWGTNPVLRNSINQVYPTILVILLFIAILVFGRFKNESISTMRLLVALILFQIIYKILGISDNTWAYHSNSFLCYFMALTTLYLFDNVPISRIKRVGIVLFGIILLSLFYHYYIYITSGYSSLYDTQVLLDEEIYVGGTTYVTAYMLLGMLCFLLFRSSESSYKLLYISVIMLVFYYIANMQMRATALLFYIAFLCIVPLFLNKQNKLFIIILFLLSVCVIFLCVKPMLSFLISADLPYFSNKLSGIYEYFFLDNYSSSYHLGESSFSSRVLCAQVSLQTWFSHFLIFLFGKGYDAGFYDVSGIGQHSEIIDYLPKYGICGFALFVFTFYMFFKRISNMTDKYIVVAYFFVIYTFFNNVLVPEIGICFFWMIPFVLVKNETIDSSSLFSADTSLASTGNTNQTNDIHSLVAG